MAMPSPSSVDPAAVFAPRATLPRSRAVFALQCILLAAIPVLYLWFVFQDFWTLPAPSDPLQYLDPAVWHSVSYFPWIDRTVVAMGLQVFTFLFSAFRPYEAGMFYIAAVNTAILVAGMAFGYYRRGFLAALITGLLLASSYPFLAYATYIYTDQTMALFALLALIFFTARYRNRWLDPALLAGFWGTLACFSKVTGVAVILFMLAWYLWRRDWPRLKKLGIGCGIGVAAVAAADMIFFGPESVAMLISGARGYYGGWMVNTRYEIDLTYFTLLSSQLVLPLFLGAVVFIGAYRDPLTRPFYLGALAFVAVLTLFIAFTRQVQAIPNYLYPAVALCGVGAGLYLGGLAGQRQPSYPPWAQVLVAALAIVLVFVVLKIGASFSGAFTNPNGAKVPGLARSLYSVVPLVIVAGMVAIEVTRRPAAILLTLLVVFSWMPAYAGAYASDKARADREEAAFFYEAAPALNKFPQKEFAIYVNEWVKSNHYDRLLWVYRSFFNQKYSLVSQAAAEEEMDQNVKLIENPREIPYLKANYILTDTPSTIRRYFPQSVETVSFPWRGVTLSVFQLRP
jgi:hypothetical protein